jgi:hypothetical protein
MVRRGININKGQTFAYGLTTLNTTEYEHGKFS